IFSSLPLLVFFQFFKPGVYGRDLPTKHLSLVFQEAHFFLGRRRGAIGSPPICSGIWIEGSRRRSIPCGRQAIAPIGPAAGKPPPSNSHTRPGGGRSPETKAHASPITSSHTSSHSA